MMDDRQTRIIAQTGFICLMLMIMVIAICVTIAQWAAPQHVMNRLEQQEQRIKLLEQKNKDLMDMLIKKEVRK